MSFFPIPFGHVEVRVDRRAADSAARAAVRRPR